MNKRYEDVKRAQSSIRIKNRLGWPDDEEGIRRLVRCLPEIEQTVIRMGHFVPMWDGRWSFSFPATADVIEVIEKGTKLTGDVVFMEVRK